MKELIIILLAFTPFFNCVGQENGNFNIGQISRSYMDDSRNRPLVTEVWYPTYDTLSKNIIPERKRELFKTINTILNASIPDGKFPLLLVSHGTGGNRFSLTWFVERMVREGYIVAAVDHYGNSTFNKIPREFVKWWERAIDIQYVLTTLLKEEDIGPKIDESRIGGVGFSLGGYTNIALAGGYVDRNITNEEESELPPEFPVTDEVIDFKNDSLIISSYNTYGKQVKDARIKAFFTMAPAIGFGFHNKEQTKEITAPIFIVAGKGDINTPIKNNALKYHKLIETSQLYLFDGDVNHYVFLNEPTDFGKQVAPEITIDPQGVDRAAIHNKVLELAIDFFNKILLKK
tara:strand:+ start:124 stop:1161 length:1038 start_codon:yes stop_codon:yes gene_type:complete